MDKKFDRTVYEIDEAIIRDNVENRKGWDRETKKRVFTFARTLNDLLVRQEVDQEVMAKDLEISCGAISNYRNGKSEPKLINLIKIADYLEVDCHYLMTGCSADNKAINKTTGLSNDSINLLSHMLNSETPQGDAFIDFIDALLSRGDKSVAWANDIGQCVFIYSRSDRAIREDRTRNDKEEQFFDFGDGSFKLTAKESKRYSRRTLIDSCEDSFKDALEVAAHNQIFSVFHIEKEDQE